MSIRSTLWKGVFVVDVTSVVVGGVAAPAGAAPAVCNRQMSRTATEHDGVPGPKFWKFLQCFASDSGYAGPIDGDLGYNSWVGVAKALKSYRMYGSNSFAGSLTAETARGLERWGGQYGSGRASVNGSLDANDYRDIAQALNNTYAGR